LQKVEGLGGRVDDEGVTVEGREDNGVLDAEVILRKTVGLPVEEVGGTGEIRDKLEVLALGEREFAHVFFEVFD
jgi:hypothetical protein